METIFRTPDLRPYFRVAEDYLSESPCVRRKYAALIGYQDVEDGLWTLGANTRESRCCDKQCARTFYGFQNGERVEVGAEIHAETAALIAAPKKGAVFILVGQTGGGFPIYGKDVYPCHTCALNIKFAGYRNIYIKTDKDTIQAVSIAKIIRHREDEWEPTD